MYKNRSVRETPFNFPMGNKGKNINTSLLTIATISIDRLLLIPKRRNMYIYVCLERCVTAKEISASSFFPTYLVF